MGESEVNRTVGMTVFNVMFIVAHIWCITSCCI